MRNDPPTDHRSRTLTWFSHRFNVDNSRFLHWIASHVIDVDSQLVPFDLRQLLHLPRASNALSCALPRLQLFVTMALLLLLPEQVLHLNRSSRLTQHFEVVY